MEGDRLFVREREDVVAARSVLEVEEFGNRDSFRCLLQFRGREYWYEYFLRVERVEFFVDDLFDLAMNTPVEWHQCPEAVRDLADEVVVDE